MAVTEYGYHEYVLPRPYGYNRGEWDAYNSKSKEIYNWICEQKWDHWGSTSTEEGTGFYFHVEENYTLFLLRWS